MKKSILVVGPALSRSGYGEQTRFALRCLATRPELFDVYIENIPWGKTGWIDNNHPEREYIDSKIVELGKKEKDFRADLSLQVTIPNEFKIYSPINIGYTAAVETDRVDHNWLISSNMMNGLIVVSQHAANSFKNTKSATETDNLITLNVPLTVVNYSYEDHPPADLDLSGIKTEFNFLAVAQISHRKDIYNTIKWFLEEFEEDSDVGLILKVYSKNCSMIDRYRTLNKIKTFMGAITEKAQCKVYLLHGDLSPGQMAALYKNKKINAFITTAHGEGFGLPIFEAATNAIPVLSPDCGGQRDFLYAPRKKREKGKLVRKVKACFIKLGHKVGPVAKEAIWPEVINADAQWAHVEGNSCKKSMRKIRENPGIYHSQAKDLAKNIKEKFSFEQKSQEFVKAIMAYAENKI